MSAISKYARVNVVLAFLTFVTHIPSWAGISYSLEPPHAMPGETVLIHAVMFNETDSTLDWSPPENLVLQWRGASGDVTRSVASLESLPGQHNVPVNAFVRATWKAVVPSGLTGLQAVNVEGSSAMLALDTSSVPGGQIAGTVAAAPIVDAGAADDPHAKDPPLPSTVVASIGASPTAGPALSTADRPAAAPQSGFDKFRSAISPYEPIYFVVGNKGGRHARYQVSFKYRLFTPSDPMESSFINHLYLGYTQTALWDLHSDSHPFIDTSYKPSLFWRKDALLEFEDKSWFLGLESGVRHESNGKAGDESRAVNYAYVQPELNYRFQGGSTLTFAPQIKAYFDINENPDYHRYAGNVDWKLRWEQDNGLVLSGLYRQGRKSRTMTKLDAAWPLRRTPLNMNGYLHFQYFNGYGETLLGYDQKSGSHFRIGLSLVP